MTKDNECCTICLEDHVPGELAARLPCGHLFHKDCVVEWLRRHCVCPVCRYELPTDSVVYARTRRAPGQPATTPTPPSVPDDAFLDYTYRRRRAPGADDPAAVERARASLETLAKRPTLREKPRSAGSVGEVVVEVGV